MANEIVDELGESGLAVYSVLDNMAGQVWNGTAFVAEVPASRASYDVPQTELSTAGRYRADWPPAIAAGRYRRRCYVKPSAALDASDLDTLRRTEFVDWDGTAVVGGYLTDGALGWGAAEVAGVPSTVLGRLRARVHELFRRKKLDRSTGVETVYGADGTTPLYKRTPSSATVDGVTTDTVDVAAP